MIQEVFFLVYFDLYVTEATHLYYLLFKLFVTKLLHCCFTLITVNPMVRWCFSSYLVLLVQIFIFDTWFAIFPIQNTISMSFSFCASLYFIGFSTSWGNQIFFFKELVKKSWERYELRTAVCTLNLLQICLGKGVLKLTKNDEITCLY